MTDAPSSDSRFEALTRLGGNSTNYCTVDGTAVNLSDAPNKGVSSRPLPVELRGRLHRSLRAATRSDQMTIDRMVLRLDLSQREDYGLLLNIHYTTLRELAMDWRDEDRGDFLEMARCLQTDLHALGFSAAAFQPSTRPTLTPGARFGVTYVLRGSRSDAMGLRHRVSPRFAASYLDFSPALSWASFLECLERHVSHASERDETLHVISGAKLVLAIFTSFFVKALA